MTELEQLCRKKAREIIAEIDTAWLNSEGGERREWERLAAEVLAKHLIEGARSWKNRLHKFVDRDDEIEAFDGVPEDDFDRIREDGK